MDEEIRRVLLRLEAQLVPVASGSAQNPATDDDPPSSSSSPPGYELAQGVLLGLGLAKVIDLQELQEWRYRLATKCGVAVEKMSGGITFTVSSSATEPPEGGDEKRQR